MPHTRRPWSWLFFAFVCLCYALLFILEPGAARSALSSFIALVFKILPAFSVVFILLFLFNVFFDRKQVSDYVGAKSGLLGWLIAIIAGVVSIGPIYPWYVLLGELKQKGMQPSLIAVLLYSRAVKPPLIPLMIYYFGYLFTSILMVYFLAFAVLNGLLVKLVLDGSGPGTNPGFEVFTRQTTNRTQD